MKVTLEELRTKAVVNVTDGACFGYADDMVADSETKVLLALVIKGRPKLFGILGREEDILIPWEKIDTIGSDVILVHEKPFGTAAGRSIGDRSILDRLLSIFGISR